MSAIEGRLSDAVVSQNWRYPRAWSGVVILAITLVLSMMDRTLPGILIEPIRATFHLKDTQLALLTGFSFALALALFSLPVSLLVDRFDRARLITLGVVTWCAMTVACGFAEGFWTLFLFRMGVGVGEAILLPASYSLISDLFARSTRPKALAAFTIGTPIGVAVALAGGGALHDYYSGAGAALTFGLAPFRAVFVTVGAMGFLVAALKLFITEPRRGASSASNVPVGVADEASSAPVVDFLRGSWRFFVPLVAGVTLFTMFTHGFLGWIVPFFLRTHGWTVAQTGAAMGSATLFAGLVGAPLGALAAVRVAAARRADAAVVVLIGGGAICLPIAILGPLAPSPILAFAAICCVLTATYSATAVAPAALMNSSPPAIRGRVAAIYVFCASLVGGGLGPVAYAAFTDYVLRDPSKVQWSLSIVSGVLLLAAIVAFRTASDGYDRAVSIVSAGEDALD